MERWSEEYTLVRVENMFVSGDPVSVDLQLLFPGTTVSTITETTLDGNLPIQDLTRLKWRTEEQLEFDSNQTPLRSTVIDLKPKQIRSFLLSIK